MKKQVKNKKEIPPKKVNFFTKYSYQIIIVLFCFLLYGNSINNNYCLDDELVVEKHPMVEQGISAIPDILTSQYSNNENMKFGYRPIVILTYAIEYSLYGINPHANHFVNILIYCLLALLLFKVLKKMFLNTLPLVSFLIVLIFVAHPLHTEVVASLKNRDEMLALMFSLLALNSFLNYFDKGKIISLISGGVLFLIGIVSKLSVLPLLVGFPLILFFFRKTNWKRIILVFLTGLIVVIIMRYGPKMFLPSTERMTVFFENPLYKVHGIQYKLSALFVSLFYYIKLLIIPYPLRYYYGYNQIEILGWDNIRIYISIAVTILLIVYVVRNIKRKDYIAFSILFFLVTVSMFLNFVKPIPGILGERFMLTSSIGFSILFVVLIFRLNKIEINAKPDKKKRRKIIIQTILILFVYSILVIPRNNAWKTRVTLFETDIAKLDNSAKANDMYASSVATKVASELALNPKMNKDQYERLISATEHYKRAIEIYPEYKFAMNKLGSIYTLYLNDIPQALKYFKMAVDIDSSFIESYSNISFCYKKLKKNDEALNILKKATKIDPENSSIRSALANTYFQIGDTVKAFKINREILKDDPLFAKAYINMAKYSILKGDTLQAMKLFHKAYNVDTSNYDACFNLNYFYNKLKKYDRARYYGNRLKDIKNNFEYRNQFN